MYDVQSNHPSILCYWKDKRKVHLYFFYRYFLTFLRYSTTEIILRFIGILKALEDT